MQMTGPYIERLSFHESGPWRIVESHRDPGTYLLVGPSTVSWDVEIAYMAGPMSACRAELAFRSSLPTPLYRGVSQCGHGDCKRRHGHDGAHSLLNGFPTTGQATS